MKKKLMLLLMLVFFIMTVSTSAKPIHLMQGGGEEANDLIRDAGLDMDKAWEAFHQAALGGTLASPELQTSVEEELMKGRALLRKARKAHHMGDLEEVKRLTKEIQLISQEIVIKSQIEKE